MSCTKHILGFEWEHHNWDRRVKHTEYLTVPSSDQWGRRVEDDNVLCRIEYVCRECGEVREGGDCGCDRARGDQCPARLAYLGEQEKPAVRAS